MFFEREPSHKMSITHISHHSLYISLRVSYVRLDGEHSDWFYFSYGVRQGCIVAPSLFLLPVDWVIQCTPHGGFLGATLGTETFMGLNYADDIAVLAKMLEVLLLALHVLKDEGCSLGLEVNWQKTKIQSTTDVTILSTSVLVSGQSDQNCGVYYLAWPQNPCNWQFRTGSMLQDQPGQDLLQSAQQRNLVLQHLHLQQS